MRGQDCCLSPVDFYELSTITNLRGHPFKLRVTDAGLDMRKFFFSNRVVGAWSASPADAIITTPVEAFKHTPGVSAYCCALEKKTDFEGAYWDVSGILLYPHPTSFHHEGNVTVLRKPEPLKLQCRYFLGCSVKILDSTFFLKSSNQHMKISLLPYRTVRSGPAKFGSLRLGFCTLRTYGFQAMDGKRRYICLPSPHDTGKRVGSRLCDIFVSGSQ
nr:unnamed protein product [Spirometra erinaceieuropaei]